MKVKFFQLLLSLLAVSFIPYNEVKAQQAKPIVVVTDCYHPYQDPGDNLDLINGYSNPDVDLKAVILDITDAFRKDTANHAVLWKDPRGPREAGLIPVSQMNYIFDKNIPFAIGPLTSMTSEEDKMEYIPQYEQAGVQLLLDILRSADQPIDVLSFGSARILAVAYNREPELMRTKINQIHLSAGTASKDYETGSDLGANMISGGEWNVALDVYAFTRILRSDLPVAIYPCAGKDGGYVKDVNNSYWELKDMSFLKRMDCPLQNYLDYALNKKLAFDFLQQMDQGCAFAKEDRPLPETFHIWETAVWQHVTGKDIVKTKEGTYLFRNSGEHKEGDSYVDSSLKPCRLEVRDDGRFRFEYVEDSNFKIFYRSNPEENERALNAIIPNVFMQIKVNDNRINKK